MMCKSMLVVGVAALCTVKTVTAAAAQTLDVVGLDGKTVAVSLDTLDTGPLQVVVPNDKRPERWIRQVNKIEVRQLQ